MKLKFIARLSLVAAALVLLTAAVRSKPSSTIRLSPQAVHVLDSLARTSRVQRIETAACVTAFTLEPLEIDSLGAAVYDRADSISIQTRGGVGLCGRGVPTVHTHVATNGLPIPSGTDQRSKLRDDVPFALIAVVRDSTWRLVLY